MDSKKITKAIIWVGLDVSKLTFDAAFIEEGFGFSEKSFSKIKSKAFPRTLKGVKQLKAWLAKASPNSSSNFIMEATSTYSKELASFLFKTICGCKVSISNAAKTSNFIKSLGLTNKTDKIDAKALAVFGKERSPREYQLPEKIREELCGLIRDRQEFVKQRLAWKNRTSEEIRANGAKSSIKRLITAIERGIKEIEANIKSLITKNIELVQEMELLTSIPGVGLIVAATIMGELGCLKRFKKAKELTSFVGLSPRIIQSGTSVNKRTRLSKRGNRRVRSILYMVAMSSFRWGYFLNVRERLLKAGKSNMCVMGVIMRKLLVLMRAIIISGEKFSPQLARSY